MLGSNAIITTYRMANTANTSAHSATPTLSGVDAYIESQQQELLAALGERPGIEVFLMHLDPCDIVIGDKVVVTGGSTYNVAGIERHENNDDSENVYIVRLHKKAPHYSD